MREILFRGRSMAQGSGWLYGDVLLYENSAQIWETIDGRKHNSVVSIETIGQFTGLTDKNGKKIFEGDIVKATFSYNNWTQDRVEKRTATYEVRYNEKYCYFYLAKRQYNMLFDGNWTYALREIEVIGNIHDNPELLEGGVK